MMDTWITCLCIILGALTTITQGDFPPSRPSQVILSADSKNIAVQWKPPANTYGNIRQYIIGWCILPEITDRASINYVDGHVNISLIPVGGDVGRVFRVRVRAVNEAGIGQYSMSRFIRPGCGKDMDLLGYTNTSIRFPHKEHELLKPGVICSWTLRTQENFTLTFGLDTTIVSSNNSILCRGVYIDISGFGSLCNHSDSVNKTSFILNTTNTTILLRTGVRLKEHGYVSFNISSIPQLPGSPTRISVQTHKHGIAVAWQPPVEHTFPITSYMIQYSIISLWKIVKVQIGPSMRIFFVNTDTFEGKLLKFNIMAVMNQTKGEISRSYFVRAACYREVFVDQNKIYNITSPLYPSYYPKDIICTWHVHTEHKLEALIHVTILDFRLEESPYCSSDYVLFSFKPTKEPECNASKIAYKMTTDQRNFTLTFITDTQIQNKGFLIQVQSEVLTSTTEISTTDSANILAPSTETDTQSTNLTSHEHNDMTTSMQTLTTLTTDTLTTDTHQNTQTHGHDTLTTHTQQDTQTHGHDPLTTDTHQDTQTHGYTTYTISSEPLKTQTTFSLSELSFFTDASGNNNKTSTVNTTNNIQEYSTDAHKQTLSNMPELTTNNMPELTTNNMPELTTNNIQELIKHNMSELTTHNMPELTANNMQELTTHNMQELTTHNMPELTANNMQELTTNSMQELTTNHIQDLTTINRQDEMTKVLANITTPLSTGPTTLSLNGGQMEREITNEKSTLNKVDVILVGVGITCFFLTTVVIVVCRRRQKQHRMRIHSELTNNKTYGHVELHNILEQGKDNSTIKTYPCLNRGPSSQPNNSVKSCNVEKRGTISNTWGNNRSRHNSFPLAHYIQMNKQLNKVLKTFSFIEDQRTLQHNLQRKRSVRRTNSF